MTFQQVLAKHSRAFLEPNQGSRDHLIIVTAVVALAEVPGVKLLEARWCLDGLEQTVEDRRRLSNRMEAVPIWLEASAGLKLKRLVEFARLIVLFVLFLEPHSRAIARLEALL